MVEVPVPKLVIHECPAYRGNYGSRKGSLVSYIILHTAEGSHDSAVNWFADPRAKASAHYVVAHDGRVTRCVSEDYAAWHAGNSLYNAASIGIELEGSAGDPDNFRETLMDSAARLCALLVDRYSIHVDRKYIIGHNEVPSPNGDGYGGANHHWDPGPYFPWNGFMEMLQSLVVNAA